MTDARDARDDAMQRADDAANEAWKADALAAIEQVAATHLFLTTDDVWAILDRSDGETTHEPRALGPVMRRAAKAKLIEPTAAYRESKRPRCHARPLKVWRSTTAV